MVALLDETGTSVTTSGKMFGQTVASLHKLKDVDGNCTFMTPIGMIAAQHADSSLQIMPSSLSTAYSARIVELIASSLLSSLATGAAVSCISSTKSPVIFSRSATRAVSKDLSTAPSSRAPSPNKAFGSDISTKGSVTHQTHCKFRQSNPIVVSGR